MNSQVEYSFDDEPTAYRFLNTVNGWGREGIRVKYGRSSLHVKINYEIQTGQFDSLLSELDDLAGSHNGCEVS
ncbi:hypothetical protein DRW07_05080 [Alteromonas sediminis]|uniref:Uncharacterized protein n=1 Tax=Alteromonas sediminis TaxID=2259342 RepID=A0A3N5YAV7_9ALTE|nr:hypothetical protein [Alteromonas sediminis]RPJ68769.1 hypothetical protein DRW07_05080 [Alteromonas sediminis]